VETPTTRLSGWQHPLSEGRWRSLIVDRRWPLPARVSIITGDVAILPRALTILYNVGQTRLRTDVVTRTCQDWPISPIKSDKEIDTPMHAIAELPIHVMLAVLLWLLAAGALWHGMRRLAKGLSEVDHPASTLRVMRGIWGVIIAVGLAALGGGVLFGSKGLLVFGVIFLGEELYETGVVLLALRAGQRGVWGQKPYLA
jgi:hypothetical protein